VLTDLEVKQTDAIIYDSLIAAFNFEGIMPFLDKSAKENQISYNNINIKTFRSSSKGKALRFVDSSQ